MLFNRAISQAEVQDLYSAGVGGTSPFPTCAESDLAQAKQNTRYYYDRKDRLIGAECGRGLFIGYEYDGNDNLVRQVYFPPDANTNGLPDLWEFLTGLTNNASAYADSDGDGWTDWQEWKAGTNPLDRNSRPDLPAGHESTIASLELPFTPTNFVMAAGQPDGYGADEIVVGADGNPNGTTNTLFIFTQEAVGWSSQRVGVGSCGITSIAIGQPTNRPAIAIYLGLRQPGSNGWVAELSQVGGTWQLPTNAVVTSTDEAAFVLGIRNTGDLLANYSADGLDGALFSLAFSNGVWGHDILSTNSSHRGLGTHGPVMSRVWRDAGLRLLDAGGIEVVAGDLEVWVGNTELPTNSVYSPVTAKWYFSAPGLSWDTAQGYAQHYGGNLVTISDANEDAWVHITFPGRRWIGLYHDVDGTIGWASGRNSSYRNWYDSREPYRWQFYGGQMVAAYIISEPGNAIDGTWSADYAYVNAASGIADATGGTAFTNRWLLPDQSESNPIMWPGAASVCSVAYSDQTNSSSVFAVSIQDKNDNGILDPADEFVLAEYIVQGNTWTNIVLERLTNSTSVAQPSYGLALAKILPFEEKLLFTAEPDGRVFAWQATNALGPLQRRLYSRA